MSNPKAADDSNNGFSNQEPNNPPVGADQDAFWGVDANNPPHPDAPDFMQVGPADPYELGDPNSGLAGDPYAQSQYGEQPQAANPWQSNSDFPAGYGQQAGDPYQPQPQPQFQQDAYPPRPGTAYAPVPGQPYTPQPGDAYVETMSFPGVVGLDQPFPKPLPVQGEPGTPYVAAPAAYTVLQQVSP